MKLLCSFLGLGLVVAANARAAAPVDYVREVKPLFAEKCYQCHSASQQKNGLRLDTAASAIQGGQHGPAIVPGKPAGSLLLQVLRGQHAKLTRMPYKKPPLTDGQVALIERWIREGAKAPNDEKPGSLPHWAFTPPTRSAPPVLPAKPAVTHPVDQFIQARLAKAKLKPAPAADRVTLIRRLSLDLLGLPPKPEEVDAFVNDRRPDAYDQLVERLLRSPHYGERWGRWWLDVARYADSNGYSIDAPRSNWRYRDWVIDALNQDLPFDQFSVWQIAGDMLPNATLEQRVATGFHRNTQINQEGGIDKEQFRIESVIDRVNTTGTAWLGLTIGCVQCHDHKFDPFAHHEYYGLFAFFNNADEPDLPLSSPDDLEKERQVEAKIAAYISALPAKDPAIWEQELKWENSLTPAQRQAQSQAVREVFDTPPVQRSDAEKHTVLAAFIEQAPANQAHQQAMARLRTTRSRAATTMIVRELAKARRTYLFIKGDFTRDGGDVKPHVPAVLHPLKSSGPPTRLDLARWLVDESNPLVARVTVNRIWQQYFGRGLVETENDFGTQGILPTHPELLDWLATEFLRQKWSLKAMHRLIVTSHTYRQSSVARADLLLVDANNRLLARQNRLRLDAEIVRDVCLAASGFLSDKMGGPSVFPPQPDGVMTLGQVRREWKPSEGADRYRRGLYTFYFRATPHPALAVFDAPDAFSTCTRRLRSNTPLQALTLLNDQAFYEFAQGLAARVLREETASVDTRLEHAFRLCLARSPSTVERQRLRDFLRTEQASFETSADATRSLKPPAGIGTAEFAAWTSVARVLLNLDETITRE